MGSFLLKTNYSVGIVRLLHPIRVYSMKAYKALHVSHHLALQPSNGKELPQL